MEFLLCFIPPDLSSTSSSSLREEECSPVQEKSLPHVPYVVQSCEIPVSNSSSQSQYHVSVQVKTEEKLIEAYKNSELLCCLVSPGCFLERHLTVWLWLRAVLQRKDER